MKIINNIIGFLKGYGNCYCGNTLWNNSNNPGIDYGNGSGRIICNECYNKNKKEIDRQNRRRGGGYDIKNHNCKHTWLRQAAASWWCPKCDSIMAFGCQHGGSIACEGCADEWERKNK